MLDFGWSEFFLIIILAIVLLGPKDIPEVVYQAGRLMRRLQYMRFALSKQFDAFMEQNDLNELRRGGGLGDLRGDVRSALTIPPPTLAVEHQPAKDAVPESTEDPDDESEFHHAQDVVSPVNTGVEKNNNGSQLSLGLQSEK